MKEIKWVVKDGRGRLLGPFPTDKVLEYISQGRLTGDEQVARYPGGNWIPIAQDPQFYDRLLSALSEGVRTEKELPPEKIEVSSKQEASTPDKEESFEEVTIIEERTEILDLSEIKKGPENSNEVHDEEVIELKNLNELEKQLRKKRLLWPVVAFSGVLILIVFVFFSTGDEHEQKVHLIRPSKAGRSLNQSDIEKKKRLGLLTFSKSDFKNLVKSQDFFVEAIEGDLKNAFLRSLLCLSYRELWPYAYQDSQDREALNYMVRSTASLDPSGLNSIQCSLTKMIALGEYDKAKGVVEKALEQVDQLQREVKSKKFYARLQLHLVSFYQFKGEVLLSEKSFATAAAYFSKVRQSWPQWVRAYIYEAEAQASSNNYIEARDLYRQALKVNENNAEVKIRLGLLQYKKLKKTDKGLKLIKAGLNSGQKIPRLLRAQAYLGLAGLYREQKEGGKALSYAKKCYALNASNITCKNLIIELGGMKDIENTKLKISSLATAKDYEVRGQFFAAQAEYKAAFESDPKNAVAALGAARCLWKLHFSVDAIEWAKKAIRADKKFLEAYVVLADYYSQRYHFAEAARVLANARRVHRKKPEIYKGYALLEMRKNNGLGAERYAKKALKLDDTDTEIYIILARSMLWSRKYKQAFRYAVRAVELSSTDSEAQILYANVLSEMQGVESGIYYLQDLIEKYPYVIDYRVALGKMYAKDDAYAKSELVFRQVVGIRKGHREGLVGLGKALQAQGKFKEALLVFFEAAAKDASDAEALFNAALLYLDINKPREAIEQLERVSRINRRYPRVHYFIGRAALQAVPRDPKRAIEEAQKERKLNPGLADSYLLAAEAHALLSQYTACALEYQKAVKIRPQDAEVYVRMSRCYRKAGNLDVAQTMLDLAQKKESGLPEIYKEQGALFELLGQKEEAIVAYEKYLALSPNARDRQFIEGKVRSLQ